MEKEFLTYPQAAKLLQVHEVTLRRLVSKRKIPYMKIGRSVRLNLTDLQSHFRQEVENKC